ncbi:endonuclease/exonuclease/phosphatase family protein [Polynucleobacter necessarius]|uniref:endonuclease/exonuclease/phosphatase family protein n=1 Tax=Polynucleobacter necessarius TaxID=576610 RepID=UPI000E09CE31|nr:endonuclease/exonuclease/phosphatase family protein [Polynucleobacter necessarius]
MDSKNASRFTVLIMNVHKGLSPLHRHSTIYQLRQKMRSHYPDLLFLQELQQEHRGRSMRFDQWPLTELTHFLSEDFWQHWHYGKNAKYRDGHHGNALLSKHPQQKGNNYDISAYRFESRGLLHSITRLDGVDTPIHCFCVHLAFFERGRERQLEAIIGHIQHLAQDGHTIVAGDFNKSLLIDKRIAIFGSVNFDQRSLRLNFEISLIVYNVDFCAKLGKLIESYLAQSDYVDPQAWTKRPTWRRYLENAAHLTSPLL